MSLLWDPGLRPNFKNESYRLLNIIQSLPSRPVLRTEFHYESDISSQIGLQSNPVNTETEGGGGGAGHRKCPYYQGLRIYKRVSINRGSIVIQKSMDRGDELNQKVSKKSPEFHFRNDWSGRPVLSFAKCT